MTGAPQLTEEEVAHRKQFWAYVLDQAEPWHREHLSRLLGTWEEGNQRWYAGQLTPPIILLAEPSIPQAYGQTGRVSGWGAKSEIRVRPSLLAGTYPHINADAPEEGRLRFAADVLAHEQIHADVLAHEQIHQWQQEITGKTEDSYHGHGLTFRDQAKLIGADLGLGQVRTMKRRGPDADLPSCAQWPHCVRPTDYYLGALVPPSRDTDDEEIARRLADRYPIRVLRRAADLADPARRTR